MENNNIELFRTEIDKIIEMLAKGKYEQIVASCAKSRLSPNDIAGAINDYGHNLVIPPSGAYECLDMIQVTNALIPTWSVRVPLYTTDEGESDLILELTFVLKDDLVHTELDDIHIP